MSVHEAHHARAREAKFRSPGPSVPGHTGREAGVGVTNRQTLTEAKTLTDVTGADVTAGLTESRGPSLNHGTSVRQGVRSRVGRC